jgi:hypothetical protein
MPTPKSARAYKLRWRIEEIYREARQNHALEAFHGRHFNAIYAHVFLSFLSHMCLVVTRLLSPRLQPMTLGQIMTQVFKALVELVSITEGVVVHFTDQFMDDRVVRIGTLEEFTAEVRVPRPIPGSPVEPHKPVVRLHLTERRAKGHSLPAKVLELHLQDLNDLGEIVWLMESHEITWLPESGPASPCEQSVYDQMFRLRDLVRAHLEGLGYEVRSGSYGIQRDIAPI